MQYIKRYIAFTLVLVIGFFLKFNTFAEEIDKTKTRLLGIIPYEKEVAVLQSGRTLKNKSRAQKSVERITLRILGRRMPLPNLKKI